MSRFGYVGAEPTQSETTGNNGVFNIKDTLDLVGDSKLQKSGPVITALIVAGGGGGRSGNVSGGGGGGAGEVRTAVFATIKGVAYGVDVGAGGGNNGTGSDSIIDEGGTELFKAKGGGTYNSKNGGSGGGGAYGNSPNQGGVPIPYSVTESGTIKAYDSGFGFDQVGHMGGTAGGGDGRNGAGGGGAGSKGGNAGSRSQSGGGSGASTYSDWATATSSGSGNAYAGGGGGAGFTGTASGGGAGAGSGGFGNGGSATANTGSGGGAGGAGFGNNSGTSGNGGNGGSGIIIFRYADTFADAASTTGSPTLYTTGGYKYYKFLSDGSITF